MLKITDAAREKWKAPFAANVDYGPELASDLAVIEGLQEELRAAFDARIRLSDTYLVAQGATYALDMVWNLLEQERERVLGSIKNQT
jgi:hypothetical protein